MGKQRKTTVRKASNKRERKSSLLIVRKKTKTGKDYHVNTKTGKRASADDYRLQWSKGKRVSNKVAEQSINYINEFVDEKDRHDIATRRAVQSDVIGSQKARKLRQRDIKFKTDSKTNTMDYYNVRPEIEAAEKGGYKIKILHEGNDRYTEYTPAEAQEIVSKFIRGLNKKVYDTKTKTKIKMKGKNYLPQISWQQDIKNKVLKLDLKNLVGNQDQEETIKIFQQHLDNEL